jgi:hypothetical protein
MMDLEASRFLTRSTPLHAVVDSQMIHDFPLPFLCASLPQEQSGLSVVDDIPENLIVFPAQGCI